MKKNGGANERILLKKSRKIIKMLDLSLQNRDFSAITVYINKLAVV